MMDPRELVAVIEAMLFVANEPLPRAKLIEFFGEDERPAAEAALDALFERYKAKESGGIVIDEAGGGLRLVTRGDLHGHLKRFFEITSSNKLSMAALETLSIIAYRQPITGPEIQELRGVSSATVLRKLLERRLVRIAGRKEVVGKPFLYATTRDFLLHFGLASLKELPPLEQFEELFGPETDGGEQGGPDPTEEAARQAADLAEREDDEAARRERDEIEMERRLAEAAAESADGPEEAEAASAEAPPDGAPSDSARAAEVAPQAAATPSGDGEEMP